MARVYQAVLHGSVEHLGRALRRSFAAAYELPDDGTPAFEHSSAERHIVLREAPSCGRYICDAGPVRVTAVWGPASPPWAGTAGAAGPVGEWAWALVAVDAPTADGPHVAGAVGIVAGLLDAERAFDGTVPLETSPFEVDAENAAELLRRLLDQRRRVPVVVLSVDERRPDLPARHAAHLARRTAGTAAVALLCDLDAEERVNRALGEGFKVYGGALRTYLAEFDPATEDYPLRHPVRSGSTLRDLGRRALDVVVAGVAGDGVRRALPVDVRRGLRLVPQVLERGIPWHQAAALPTGAAPRPCAPAAAGRTVATAGAGREAGVKASYLRSGAPVVGAPAVPGARNPVPGPRREQPGRLPAHSPTTASLPPAADPANAPRTSAAPAGSTPARSAAPAVPGRSYAGAVGVPARQPVSPPPSSSPSFQAALSGEIAALVVAALREGAAPAPAAADADAAAREFGKLVGQLRGLVDKLGEELRSAHQDSEAEALAAELARLRDDYDLLVLQYEELAEESRRSEDRIRRLDGLLSELSAGADAVPAYDVWIPECLADVLRRARTELPCVSLPDSLDAGAATLDKAEPGLTRVWAGAAWDALRALNAYAQARSANTFRGGFRDWCRNPPHGAYALSPKKFAMKESDAVAGRAKFRKARTFPVPPEVAPEQAVFMEAHVKLRGIGNPAPRMHFHDDAAGATGRIHVGYLGHHLDNTRTN